jgi:hypothetical protein
VADQPREPDRPEIYQRHAEPAAVNAEDGIARGHTKVAPQRQFQASRYGVTFHGCDYRFREKHARRTHRSVAFFGHAVAAALGDGFQIRTGAKRSSGAGQHRDFQLLIPVEFMEDIRKLRSGRTVDGIAHLRPIDGDDQNIALLLS